MEIEIISFIANAGALTLAGILYAVYVKNLHSQISLKSEQVNTAEQAVKLWKDRALELERKSPQFVEKVLSDRIRMIEDELARLVKDGESHRSQVDMKNAELETLKSELEAAQKIGRSTSIYDPKQREFRQVSASELTLEVLGELWVDSATLLVCDPFHLSISREREIQDFPVYRHMLRDVETGDICYVDSYRESIPVENLVGVFTAAELVEMGRLEELQVPDELPAFPDTYIKGEKLAFVPRNKSKEATFYNGVSGAGVSVGTHGDGLYEVKAEVYQGEVQRIIIDF